MSVLREEQEVVSKGIHACIVLFRKPLLHRAKVHGVGNDLPVARHFIRIHRLVEELVWVASRSVIIDLLFERGE